MGTPILCWEKAGREGERGTPVLPGEGREGRMERGVSRFWSGVGRRREGTPVLVEGEEGLPSKTRYPSLPIANGETGVKT